MAIIETVKDRSRERKRHPVRHQGQSLPLIVHVALLLISSILLGSAIAYGLWSIMDRPSLGGTPDAPWTPANTFDAIKIILAAIAGLGGVVALTVAYRRQHLGEAADRREKAREQREEMRLATERFAKSAELLGSEKAATRLAGVHAVAALGDDWPSGRQTCIDLLCSYLRMPYSSPLAKAPTPSRQWKRWIDRLSRSGSPGLAVDELEQERQVRLTVLRVIRERLLPTAPAGLSWVGHNFDFTAATFDGGDLAGICLSTGELIFDDSVFLGNGFSFEGAVFNGGHASFKRALFRDGEVSFRSCSIERGSVSFAQAKFDGCPVSFYDASLTGGSISFEGSILRRGGITFRRATFSGTLLFFTAVEHVGAEVAFTLAEITAGRISFADSFLKAGKLSFAHAKLSSGEVNFSGASFMGSDVSFRTADPLTATIDLRMPRDWSCPPTFDASIAGPYPSNILLPKAQTAALPSRAIRRYRAAKVR